jgi:PAS domain S-box-containing protein
VAEVRFDTTKIDDGAERHTDVNEPRISARPASPPAIVSAGSLADNARRLFQPGLQAERQWHMMSAAVTATRMPMVVSDARQPDRPIVLANPAFLEMTGYSAAEVLGRNCRFLQGPDTDPHAIQQVRDALATDREIEIELVNHTKDGTPFPNRLLIVPIRDENGAVSFHFGSQQDLRPERAALVLSAQKEERLRLVAEEMNHRINNTLATVQAIVRQTLRNTGTSPTVADTIGARLVALRDAHALLTQRDWRNSDLREVIASAIQPHRDGTGRFEVEGPRVDLEPTPSLAMAMAVHELCTNAVKYGALSVPGGVVTIGWEVTRHEGNRGLHLRWQERGGPPVSAPSHRGFGSMLIKDALAADLNGSVALEYAESGVICVIEASLPAT